MSDPDPALARANATVPDALDLHELSVIGVLEAHDGAAALLRSSRGQIARVMTGDAAFGMTVTVIGDDMIMMTDRWGRTQSLHLPKG